MRSRAQTLEVQRVVAARPELVFDAWTTPSELVLWWTPPDGRCIDASVDLRPGGRYAIVNELPGGTVVTIQGEYLIVEPPSLLRFTWTTDDRQPATEVVTVVFESHAEGTEVRVTHTRVPSGEALQGHAAGWHSCLDGLVGHVAQARPPQH